MNWGDQEKPAQKMIIQWEVITNSVVEWNVHWITL